MKVLILGAICLYSVSACIWVVWEGLKKTIFDFCETAAFKSYSVNTKRTS